MGLVAVFLCGAVIALSIGLYAKLHTPSGRPVTTLGFSGLLQMKAWLTTAATGLLFVQVTTALWMWGKLPRVAGYAPAWAQVLHRFSGSIAFILTLPWRSAASGRSGSRPTAGGWSSTGWSAASFMVRTQQKCSVYG